MSRELNVEQIKKLWTLDLIIRCGSLKEAALRAKVSPSAVSQALSSLEQALGRPLIIRDRGRITPTAAALSILEVVRPAFGAFEKLKDLNQTPVPKMSWLSFGTYESIAVDILPQLIESLRDKMPHLRLNLQISRTANLLTMVRKGELCSALIAEVDHLDRFYSKVVAEDRLGLYVSRRHEIYKAGWKALDRFGLGSLNPGKAGLPRYFTKFLRQLQPHKPFVLSDSFETLRKAASEGVLVAVLPHRVAMREQDLMELVPPKDKTFRSTGKHKILVVSQANCDPEEANFLAAEAKRLFHQKPSHLSSSTH